MSDPLELRYQQFASSIDWIWKQRDPLKYFKENSSRWNDLQLLKSKFCDQLNQHRIPPQMIALKKCYNLAMSYQILLLQKNPHFLLNSCCENIYIQRYIFAISKSIFDCTMYLRWSAGIWNPQLKKKSEIKIFDFEIVSAEMKHGNRFHNVFLIYISNSCCTFTKTIFVFHFCWYILGYEFRYLGHLQATY